MTDLARARSKTSDATPADDELSGVELERRLEQHRRELTGYCYRMLGSSFEAEDAVQDTMVRAWRAYDRFEGRSALRSWLYRIATNVCLDMLNGHQRRARPMDMSAEPAGRATHPGPALPEATWI
ncbi:MAG: sigma-70 family RNA polymerase sigma factor, partial [Ilumatobacteraceae bacterium]